MKEIRIIDYVKRPLLPSYQMLYFSYL